jgi:YidC/Oxa1 family membrane protein insertase
MLYPLNNWSMKSTAKLQKIAPKVQAIQEKYKKDPNRARTEIMNIYRQEGANPVGGCLPLLIQLPFLFGMFDLLKTSFELRGASFIPGWIDNLSAPDVIFSWSYPLPLIGTNFHLLPIFLGVIMFFQQRMMSPASAGAVPTDQQRQQRFMGNIMTVVFTVLFYNFPSGLNLYWISSMLLGILQQWWVNKQLLAKGK